MPAEFAGRQDGCPIFLFFKSSMTRFSESAVKKLGCSSCKIVRRGALNRPSAEFILPDTAYVQNARSDSTYFSTHLKIVHASPIFNFKD